MELRLRDQRVILTGGTHGIGREVARLLAGEGWCTTLALAYAQAHPGRVTEIVLTCRYDDHKVRSPVGH